MTRACVPSSTSDNQRSNIAMRGRAMRAIERLTPGRFRHAGDVARKAFFRCIDCGAPCEGGAGLDQPDRRRADRPGRRAPRLGSDPESSRTELPIVTCRSQTAAGLTRPQVRVRQAVEIASQCKGTVADIRPADTDEFVAAAKIEAPFENGFDVRLRNASAEFLRQHACSQDRNDRVSSADHGSGGAERRNRGFGRVRVGRPRRSRRPRPASAPARRAAAGPHRCR